MKCIKGKHLEKLLFLWNNLAHLKWMKFYEILEAQTG